MAKLRVDGLNAVVDEMKRMGALTGPVADDMLKRGARELETGWRSAIDRYRHIDSEEMRKSVGMTRIKTSGETGKSTDVYPLGNDGKRTNAEKAFVLHYGRSNMTGTHFVDKAIVEGEPKTYEAMEARWDSFMNQGR